MFFNNNNNIRLNNIKSLKVALTYNIKPDVNEDTACNNDEFAEWDTEETIFAVRDALSIYHNVILIEADINCYNKLIETNPDIVFNIAEGKRGINREAFIPSVCEFLDIPYTGSDPLTLSSTLHKARTKEILIYNNIHTPKYRLIENISRVDDCSYLLPAVVKPLSEGSSKGIYNSCLVYDIHHLYTKIEETLTTYKQPCIVEHFLNGREFTVALLGNKNCLQVLPIVEINFSALPMDLAPIYSFEAKWVADTTENPLDIFTCPAVITPDLEQNIIKTAIKSFNILGCRDWGRIDIRLDENNIPNIIEINPLPGILPNPSSNSCYPKAARAAGLNYNEMINRVLLAGCKRYNIQ